MRLMVPVGHFSSSTVPGEWKYVKVKNSITTDNLKMIEEKINFKCMNSYLIIVLLIIYNNKCCIFKVHKLVHMINSFHA